MPFVCAAAVLAFSCASAVDAPATSKAATNAPMRFMRPLLFWGFRSGSEEDTKIRRVEGRRERRKSTFRVEGGREREARAHPGLIKAGPGAASMSLPELD